jgi:GTP-binding protein
VVVNKIDKPDANIQKALNKTFDLFLELGADDATADFPIVYAAAKLGLAGLEPDLDKMTDIIPIFETIVKNVPPPHGDPNHPLQMLITSVTYDNFKGRIAIGKIHNGSIATNQDIKLLDRDGLNKKYRLTSLLSFVGLERVETPAAQTGDIVAISGIAEAMIGETIADVNESIALPLLSIEEPTVKMTFLVNDSPFAGTEGQFTTSRQIRERLMKELETDMALKVEDAESGGWIVSGRGELHLAILIERLRREGYELQVSRPQVIIKEVDGKKMAPFEQVLVEVPEAHSGIVIQKLGSRNGQMTDLRTENNIVFLEFIIPTRGLFGYRSEFLTDTKGLGILHTNFAEYRPDSTNWRERDRGSLVAHENGATNLYGLLNIQERGTLFLGPGIDVYKGQIVGQNARSEDMRVNVCKAKELSNMRSKGDGVNRHFDTPKTMGLEDALEYISDDELVEITPKNIRIRKVVLDEQQARRQKLGIKN